MHFADYYVYSQGIVYRENNKVADRVANKGKSNRGTSFPPIVVRLLGQVQRTYVHVIVSMILCCKRKKERHSFLPL